jgi:hypothetical protein
MGCSALVAGVGLGTIIVIPHLELGISHCEPKEI